MMQNIYSKYCALEVEVLLQVARARNHGKAVHCEYVGQLMACHMRLFHVLGEEVFENCLDVVMY